MSELNYKELQEKGVFDVPYKAFQFMQEQQAKIDLIEKEIVETQEFLNKQNHIKQAEIDDLKKIIKMQECGVDAIKKTLNEIYDACDEDETVAMLLDKIQELLK